MPVEETIWPAAQHTKAKLRILKGYLDAWAPILSQRAAKGRCRPPIYVDGFAGPGIHQNADGSPLVAIKAILHHTREMPSPIRMTFIEARDDRFRSLEGQLKEFRASSGSRFVVERLLHTKCEDGVRELIREEVAAHGSFGPALFFFDQFGYSAAPMALIGEVMRGTSCEALVYFEYKQMNRALGDADKTGALNKAFGSDRWQAALDLRGQQRRKRLHDEYMSALQEAGARFVWPFEMKGQKNELLYWLFFCSTNLLGLKAMKKSMLKVDGNFSFSDRHFGQLSLLADEYALASELHRHFLGQTVRKGEVKRYVLMETPCVNYRQELALLEREERLRVLDPPLGRKRGNFGFDDSVLIEFLVGPGKQAKLF